MRLLLARLLTFIFLALAVLHFYWASGGLWGLESTLPTTAQGQKVLAPTPKDSLVVGLLLALCSAFYLLLVSSFAGLVRLKKVGLWVIPLALVLRAVGDFQYVGFFKRITGTEFAHWDTLFFSPLCLTIGVLGLALIPLERAHRQRSNLTS